MGITSYAFMLLFLPVVLAGWTVLNKAGRYMDADLFLIAASVVFIGSYDYRFVFVILATAGMNYMSAKYAGSMGSARRRKVITAFMVAVNLGTLVFLKYCNWFRVLADPNAALLKLLLPIGISFYTLEQISFIVDTYKTGRMEYTFAEYLMFSTYFPAAVSGPILRHDDFILQIRDKKCRMISQEDMCAGMVSLCLGMGKKAIIASYLGNIAAFGFDNVMEAKCLTMVISVLAYALQLYFDFSGYCDIVEGVSAMMGFSLPANFNSPYKAVSIGEFWKRWHMTLTGFLTRYVYIPLGGNRKGLPRQYINIFLVFLISGFWHGASFTYVLWGIMHGTCMVIDKVIGNVWVRLPQTAGRLVTFVSVALMWVPFRAGSIRDAYIIYWTMAFGERSIVDSFGQYTFPVASHVLEICAGVPQEIIVKVQGWATVLILAVLSAIVFHGKNVMEIRKGSEKTKGMAALCGIILFASVLHFQGVGNFIYEGF